MILQLIAAHPVWAVSAAVMGGLALLTILLIAATRAPGRHRGQARSVATTHAPRHAKGTPRPGRHYAPRHEVAQSGLVQLGHSVDGDITLVHAAPPVEPAVEVRPDDEPTVEVNPALIGATA